MGGLAPGVTATLKDVAGNIVGKFSGTPGGVSELIAPTELTPRPGEDLMVTILIEIDSGTPIGPYDIPLQVETSTIFRAIPLGLLVVSPGANIVLSPMGGPADTDINIALIEINGRYPDQDIVTNEEVKETVFVVEGKGKIVIDKKECEIEEGDAILILPNQKYFFDGSLKLVISCNPAWYPEQHKNIQEP